MLLSLHNLLTTLVKIIFSGIVYFILIIQSLAQTGRLVPELAPLDSVVNNFMYRWHIPQGSIAVVKDGRLAYARAFGSSPLGLPTLPSDLFRIASLSKPITATAIMMLVDKGWLDLDAPVFGEFGILDDSVFNEIADNRVLEITVRDLLQHTGGWDREISGDPMFSSSYSIQTPNRDTDGRVGIIQDILKRPLDFSPGTRYAYSNLGYNILGRIIETVTGIDYENYVLQSVLSPLQIIDMKLARNNTPAIVAASGTNHLAMNQETNDESSADYLGFNIEAMDANGGWMASATDLARFTSAFDKESASLLSPESIGEMLSPSTVNPIYGLGWFVNKDGNCWHTGSLNGTSAFMAKLANGTTGVILFNIRPETNTKKFFTELDNLLWSGIKKVKVWPTHNLFQDGKMANLIHANDFLNEEVQIH